MMVRKAVPSRASARRTSSASSAPVAACAAGADFMTVMPGFLAARLDAFQTKRFPATPRPRLPGYPAGAARLSSWPAEKQIVDRCRPVLQAPDGVHEAGIAHDVLGLGGVAGVGLLQHADQLRHAPAFAAHRLQQHLGGVAAGGADTVHRFLPGARGCGGAVTFGFWLRNFAVVEIIVKVVAPPITSVVVMIVRTAGSLRSR